MTLDEAIKHCEEVAEKNECKMTSDDGYTDVSMKQCAADHRQLAEWLTDYKELKNSIGAAKFGNMKEALELIREYKAENIAQKKLIAEYKRLLKAAVDDMTKEADCGICLHDNDGECPIEVAACKFKWRYADETLKLLNDKK